MKIELELTKEQKDLIAKAADRIMTAEQRFIVEQNECLDPLLKSLGYAVNGDTRGLILEGLAADETGGAISIFWSKDAWAKALSKVLENETLNQAEALIEEMKKKKRGEK